MKLNFRKKLEKYNIFVEIHFEKLIYEQEHPSSSSIAIIKS